jgi:alanine racemase
MALCSAAGKRGRKMLEGALPQTVPPAAGGVLTIDLAAIRANYALLRSRLSGAVCAAVVKADAYGLGAARVAPALAEAGCRHFFVAHLDEAIALRPYVPTGAEVFVLNGLPPGAEAAALAHHVTPVLNSLAQVDAWAESARACGRALPAVLQVDTGMSRLGLSRAEIGLLAEDAHLLDGIALDCVMSHLACAEQPDHPLNAEQLDRFRSLRRKLPPTAASLANSSGIFLGPEYHFDLARPGAALYGIAPVAGQPNPMRQVVRLHGRLVQVREIEAGAAVGYGATWRANGPRRIATVSVGYADGFPRNLGNCGNAFIGANEVPLVGVVSMDTATFDVSNMPPDMLQPGSLIELIGDRNPLDSVARRVGTIGYEIPTRLGHRYHRRYIGG